MHAVAEGLWTTRSVFELAEKDGVEMPIMTEVYRVLYEDVSPEAATDALMGRPSRPE